MTKIFTSFENGTNGAPVTAAQIDGWSFVFGTMVYSNVDPLDGALSLLIDNPGTNNVRVFDNALSLTRVELVAYVKLTTLPGTDLWLFYTQSNSATVVSRAIINPQNQLRLNIAGATPWTDDKVFPTNQWIRLAMYTDIGSGGDTGSVRLAYYDRHSTTPISDTGLLTGLPLVAVGEVIQSIWVGKGNNNAYSGQIYIDALTRNTDTDATTNFSPLVLPPQPSGQWNFKKIVRLG